MKRLVVFLWIAMISSVFALSAGAQTFGGPDFMKGKKVVGGNINAGISGGCFNIGLAPQFGFRLTRSLEVGVRTGYDFYHFYNNYVYGSYFCHLFSGALYANYEIFSGVYAHIEDEETCLLIRGKAVNPTAPKWSNSVFVGAGYRQYSSSGAFIYYAILYNLSWKYDYTGDSPYASPYVIRVGYCFSF